MRKVMMILTVMAVSFTSCKKNETTTKTTSEKIAGIWMGDETVLEIVPPPPLPTQTINEDLSYLNINLKSDGTFSADSAGVNIETGNWSAPNSSTFILDGETFEIKTLTDSQFHFGMDSVIDLGGGSTASMSNTVKLKK